MWSLDTPESSTHDTVLGSSPWRWSMQQDQHPVKCFCEVVSQQGFAACPQRPWQSGTSRNPLSSRVLRRAPIMRARAFSVFRTSSLTIRSTYLQTHNRFSLGRIVASVDTILRRWPPTLPPTYKTLPGGFLDDHDPAERRSGAFFCIACVS